MTKSGVARAALVLALLSLGRSGIAHETLRGPEVGIKVHGSWTIVVRNPDGSIAATTKFENSLVQTGATLLTQLLTHQKTVQHWQIQVNSRGGGLCARGTTPEPCGILDSALTADVSSDFATLTASVPTSGENAGKLVLSGTAPAALDGNIQIVKTSVAHTCAPTACGMAWIIFTTAYPDNPVHVQAGQTMNVTVVISFS
jgi:hypothetical protein